MRLRSTPESIENEEISLLAVVETICSVILYIYIAREVLQSWTPIVIAVSIAPFLLLRTSLSTERGLRWIDIYLDRFAYVTKAGFNTINTIKTKNHLLSVLIAFPIVIIFVFLILLLLVISTFIIRVLSITLTALQHPLSSLGAIPRNWFSLKCCTDFFYPPEIVHGVEYLESPSPNLNTIRISFWIEVLREYNAIWIIKILRMMLLAVLLVASLPYSYSLKSTAIVWLPLLWIVSKAQTDKSLSTRLKLLNKSSWGRFVAFLSCCIILVFIAKLVLLGAVYTFVERWNSIHVASLIDQFIEPFAVPWWQIASVLNAVLALVLYCLASYGLILLSEPGRNENSMRTLDVTVRTGKVLKAILSVYTSICLLYIVVSQMQAFRLPPVGGRLFPWF